MASRRQTVEGASEAGQARDRLFPLRTTPHEIIVTVTQSVSPSLRNSTVVRSIALCPCVNVSPLHFGALTAMSKYTYASLFPLAYIEITINIVATECFGLA